MKIEPRNFNPLVGILQTIPDRIPQYLTVEQVGTIISLLSIGGIHCENHNDTVSCLKALHELGILEVDVIQLGRTVQLKVGNKYNGK